jgi:hypothetical protein
LIKIEHLIANVKACPSESTYNQQDHEKKDLKACYEKHQTEVRNVWSDGIKKFIDFAIDLREHKQESVFNLMMEEYVMAERAWEKEHQKSLKDKQQKALEVVAKLSLELKS